MQRSAQPHQGPADIVRSRDLSAAISACFSTETVTPAFPDRLIELITALTNQRNVAIWHLPPEAEEPEILAQDIHAKLDDKEMRIAQEFLSEHALADSAVVRAIDQYFAATIALPGGWIGVLLLALPSGAAVVRSLAYERLTLLANLSFSQFKHGDLVRQLDMVRAVSGIASGDRDQTQALADTLARLMGADYAASGFFNGYSITDLAISGQSGMTKRAQLPAKLRESMSDIAQKKVRSNDRYFAAESDSREGLVVVVDQPKRNIGMLQLAGAVFGQAQQGKPAGRWSFARLGRIAVFALALVGVGMIPINDGTEIPATVESVHKRIVTAPLSSSIAHVLVKDKQRVIEGETVLLQLDTQEIEIELLGLAAERSIAVLERETARAGRNASLLRNAELEVQRLDAQIALLELNRDNSDIISPISGIAVLNGLEQRTGATVRQGEALLEVSDPNQLRLSLAIVESKVSDVDEADSGLFRPDFDPSLRLEANVTTISPAIDNSEDVPVTLGKADFAEPAENLRPGLRGVFAVSQEWRPIWQVLYDNVRDWILLRVWL